MPTSARRRGLSCCCFASSRACVSAASMAAPSRTSPSMRRTTNGATTPAGSRRRPRWGSSCPSSSLSRRGKRWGRKPSTRGAGGSRSCSHCSWWRSPSTSGCSCRRRRSSRPSRREAFWSENIRYVLIASVVVIGEGVVWYSGQFWALYFIQQVQKPDVLTPAVITGAALLIATPSLIFFGWLSDRIGRKPIILAGFFLAAVTYYPLYNALGNAANPANINYPLSILFVAIMVGYVGMVYGPIGAFLAEYFPARIRYSSVSVPYHIGNGWGGGLVPVITTAAYVTAQA